MQQKFVAMLAATMLMAVPVCSFAAITSDEVTSSKIKEATTGSTNQDTNSGNGIKTNHIVDTAVTTQKIKDGAVTPAKLAACSANQMLLFNGTAWVCSAPVAGPKGDMGDQGLPGKDGINGLNGTNGIDGAPGAQGPKGDTGPQGPAATYGNVIVVAKSGGDFTDPVAAINSIADASINNPYLVKIMPGVYDLGASVLTLKQYVDIEGAGENVTKIVGIQPVDWCLVNGKPNSSLRLLSVSHSGGENTCAIRTQGMSLDHVTAIGSLGRSGNRAIFVDGISVLSNVTAITQGLAFNTSAIYIAGNSTVTIKDSKISCTESNSINYCLWSQYSSISLTNVNIYATGTSSPMGAFISDSNTSFENVTINAGTGVAISNGTTLIRNSSITASGYSLTNNSASPLNVVNTKIVGSYDHIKSVNCYDGNFDPIPNGSR